MQKDKWLLAAVSRAFEGKPHRSTQLKRLMSTSTLISSLLEYQAKGELTFWSRSLSAWSGHRKSSRISNYGPHTDEQNERDGRNCLIGYSNNKVKWRWKKDTESYIWAVISHRSVQQCDKLCTITTDFFSYHSGCSFYIQKTNLSHLLFFLNQNFLNSEKTALIGTKTLKWPILKSVTDIISGLQRIVINEMKLPSLNELQSLFFNTDVSYLLWMWKTSSYLQQLMNGIIKKLH